MGSGAVNNFGSAKIAITDHFNEIRSAILGTVYPRDPSSDTGALIHKGADLGSLTVMWRKVYAEQFIFNGTLFDPSSLNTGDTNNSITSGRVRSGSQQPLFLQADGSARTVSVLGDTTSLQLTVDGEDAPFITDYDITSLTAAPSSNNTALVDDSNLSDQEFTKYLQEIPYDTAGSEITSRDGEVHAFQLSSEIFLAYIDNTNSILKVLQRGFFFDSSDAPIEVELISDNDTITLLQVSWIFAEQGATTAIAINNTPVFSAIEPSSPATNDHWFDLATYQWKFYSGGSFQDANRLLIGVAACNTSACIASRCVDFTKNFDDLNTITLEKTSATTLRSKNINNLISVYSNVYDIRSYIEWDMASHLESGVSETNSTYYYFYLTEEGEPKISDIAPVYNHNRKGGYHPFHTWRFIARCYNDSSGDLEAQVVHFIKGEKIVFESDTFFINPNGLDFAQVYGIGGGASGNGGTPTNGGDTSFGFDLSAAGGNTGGTASTGSSGDLVYESDGSSGIPDSVFRHVIQLSVVGLTTGSADGVGYGDGGYNAGQVGGGGGSAFKEFSNLKEKYSYHCDIGAGGDNPAGTVDGADGVLIIQL